MTQATCRSCGAEIVPTDRFCEVCGLRQPSEDDRTERDFGPAAAGVTDRGKRHPRNEDAFALRIVDGRAVVAVVCDGVSTSDRPDQAARLACATALDTLVEALGADTDPGTATGTAIGAASKAVIALADPGVVVERAPACTYVSAVTTEDTVVVGWLGDSRAAWLAADATSSSAWLTTDDSWAQEMVTSGQLGDAEAAADPRAHALTGWLGADAGERESTARLVAVRPTGPGVLLLCSDGLWNYRSGPDELAGMIMPDAPQDPLLAAKTLVQFALDSGGQDNITAAVIPFPPLLSLVRKETS
jgi:serine/threonine protein phosphatase PrpC